MSDERIARLEAWTHQHGALLRPIGADTYGNGMREAKRQVARIIGDVGTSALAGIDDPAQFVQDVRDLLAAWNEGDDLQAAIDAVSRHLPESK